MKILQRRLVRVIVTAVAVIGWGAILVAPTGASAALVTFSYQGTVNSVDSLLSSQFAIGDLFTFTYTFESTTADTFAGTAFGNYAISSWTGTIGSYTATGSSGFIGVSDGGIDQYGVRGDNPATGALPGLNPLFIDLLMTDLAATAFSDDSLPLLAPLVTSFPDSSQLSMRFNAGTLLGAPFVRTGPLTATVNVVPLPAALPLFGSALAMLGIVGWRRRRPAAG